MDRTNLQAWSKPGWQMTTKLLDLPSWNFSTRYLNLSFALMLKHSRKFYKTVLQEFSYFSMNNCSPMWSTRIVIFNSLIFTYKFETKENNKFPYKKGSIVQWNPTLLSFICNGKIPKSKCRTEWEGKLKWNSILTVSIFQNLKHR